MKTFSPQPDIYGTYHGYWCNQCGKGIELWIYRSKLRAAGVDYDVRVHTPYSSYEDFEFNIPVGTTGDYYDRLLVRNEEMWQSLRIIEQAYRKVQEFKGAEAEVFHADVPEYYLPEKEDVYTKMEALIWHFKIIMGEIDIPAGEVYQSCRRRQW